MKFRIGDLVRLNREGFQGVRPSTPEESRAALEGSRIVDMEQVTPDGLFAIDLDGPLSIYLINSDWIEHVNAPAQHERR